MGIPPNLPKAEDHQLEKLDQQTNSTACDLTMMLLLPYRVDFGVETIIVRVHALASLFRPVSALMQYGIKAASAHDNPLMLIDESIRRQSVVCQPIALTGGLLCKQQCAWTASGQHW